MPLQHDTSHEHKTEPDINTIKGLYDFIKIIISDWQENQAAYQESIENPLSLIEAADTIDNLLVLLRNKITALNIDQKDFQKHAHSYGIPRKEWKKFLKKAKKTIEKIRLTVDIHCDFQTEYSNIIFDCHNALITIQNNQTALYQFINKNKVITHPDNLEKLERSLIAYKIVMETQSYLGCKYSNKPIDLKIKAYNDDLENFWQHYDDLCALYKSSLYAVMNKQIANDDLEIERINEITNSAAFSALPMELQKKITKKQKKNILKQTLEVIRQLEEGRNFFGQVQPSIFYNNLTFIGHPDQKALVTEVANANQISFTYTIELINKHTEYYLACKLWSESYNHYRNIKGNTEQSANKLSVELNILLNLFEQAEKIYKQQDLRKTDHKIARDIDISLKEWHDFRLQIPYYQKKKSLMDKSNDLQRTRTISRPQLYIVK